MIIKKIDIFQEKDIKFLLKNISLTNITYLIMCAIYGLYSNNYNSEKLNLIASKCLELIKHRGPDESKIKLYKNFICGVNRLSIEALKDGSQPIEDEKFIAGFNGEIFNYKELIKKFNFKNIKSEINLILNLWKIKGLKITDFIKGQYAIFIFDKIKKKVFLFRDPFGIRPLYYAIHNKQLVFSSEIKSIVKTGLKKYQINKDSISQTSMFWVNVGNSTSFESIYSLRPGSYLVWDENDLKSVKFFNFPIPENSVIKKKDVNLYEELDRAVNRQIHGEVDYGCYVSGGIDSSALAYILSKKKKINTFSISFKNSEYDESDFQNLFLKKLNSNHHNLLISEKMISDNFSTVINHLETILFRTAPVPMYLLSKLVNEKNIKVIYSGEGADEILFGYDIFFENRIRKFWKKNPNSNLRPLLLKKLYNYLPQFQNSRYFSIMQDFYRSTLKTESIFYSHLVRWSQFKHVSSFFNIDSTDKVQEKIIREYEATLPKNFNNLSSDQKNQYIETDTLLANYLLSSQGDRMSMANSVEGRHPFLDEDFVETISNFNSKKLAPGISSKQLFRNSFKNLLPNEIVNRPKTAYQAPEAKCFINDKFVSETVSELFDNLDNLELINKKNFMNLISKLKDPFSSKRIGFRENMAFIMAISYHSLTKSLNNWTND